MRKHRWLFVCCVGLGAIFTSGCQRGGKPTGEPDVSESSVRSAELTPAVVEKTSEKPGEVVSERPRQVTVGEAHSCAITKLGAARCWGENGFGQLGDGTTEDRIAPTPVLGLESGVRSITAGESARGYYTCALLDSGGVKCWGEQRFGQLGNGTIDNGSRAVFVAE